MTRSLIDRFEYRVVLILRLDRHAQLEAPPTPVWRNQGRFTGLEILSAPDE